MQVQLGRWWRKTVSPSHCQWATQIVLDWCQLVQWQSSRDNYYFFSSLTSQTGRHHSTCLESQTKERAMEDYSDEETSWIKCLSLDLTIRLGQLCSIYSRNRVIVSSPSRTPWYHPDEGIVGHQRASFFEKGNQSELVTNCDIIREYVAARLSCFLLRFPIFCLFLLVLDVAPPGPRSQFSAPRSHCSREEVISSHFSGFLYIRYKIFDRA